MLAFSINFGCSKAAINELILSYCSKRSDRALTNCGSDSYVSSSSSSSKSSSSRSSVRVRSFYRVGRQSVLGEGGAGRRRRGSVGG
jgi:hypothetical protein